MLLISRQKPPQFLSISDSHMAVTFPRQAVLLPRTQTWPPSGQSTQEACCCFESLKFRGCLLLQHRPASA